MRLSSLIHSPLFCTVEAKVCGSLSKVVETVALDVIHTLGVELVLWGVKRVWENATEGLGFGGRQVWCSTLASLLWVCKPAVVCRWYSVLPCRLWAELCGRRLVFSFSLQPHKPWGCSALATVRVFMQTSWQHCAVFHLLCERDGSFINTFVPCKQAPFICLCQFSHLDHPSVLTC